MKYVVMVKTTLRKEFIVEASNEEEARLLVDDRLDETIDTDDIETEMEVYK